MKRLARLGSFAALIVAAATYPAVALLAAGATDAYVIAAKSKEMVSTNKAIFDAREPKESDAAFHRRVMEIYGNPIDYTTPVLFVSKEKLVRPEEAPSLVLLPVDKEKGENPLQVKTLYFLAKYVVIGAAAACAALVGLSLLLKGPPRNAPPAPAP